jgi:hypothetical protein
MQRLEVSGAVRPIYGSLGAKGLTDRNYVSAHNAYGVDLRTNSDYFSVQL